MLIVLSPSLFPTYAEPSWDSAAADEDLYRIHHHHPRGAPYYSTLVEPSMTLGEQWPPHGHKVIKGFQRVTYGQRPKILVREKVLYYSTSRHEWKTYFMA